MPVPDGRRKRCDACGTVTKVLIVVVVAIAAVTLVWFCSSVRSAAESSGGTINGTRVAMTSTATDRFTVDNPLDETRPRDRQTLPASERAPTGRPSSDRSPTDRPEMVARLSAAGWSPNAAVAIRDDRRHVIGPPRNIEGRTPRPALRDRPTKRNDYYWFSASDDRDDDGERTRSTTRVDDQGTPTWQHVGTGPSNHYDHSTAGTDKWTAAGPDGSSSYHDSYDLTADDYNYINNINKQLTDEPIGGGGGNPVVESESHYSTVHESYPESTDSTTEYRPQSTRSQPPSNHRPPSMAYPPSANYYPPGLRDDYYPPSPLPPPPGMSYEPPRTGTTVAQHQYPGNAAMQPKIVVPVEPGKAAAAVYWKSIAVLALVKLALVKLKAFSAINVLVFVLVGVKLLLMAVSLKFLLLLKFVKFLKLLALPLILLPLFTAIVTALFPFGRMLQSMMPAVQAPTAAPSFSNVLPTLRPTIPSQSTSSGVLRPGGSTFLPGVPSRVPGQSTATNTNLRPQSAFKLDDFNAPYGRQHYQTLDPTLDVFRKLLDSEKCVERIACRMAGAEKAGIFPSWINWMLNGVSEAISNEKLKLYLKAYNDVTNNNLVNSTNANSWATWCLERYDCNL